MLLSPSVQAEIYKVIDKDGNVKYTDKKPHSEELKDSVSVVEDTKQKNVTDSKKTIEENQPEWLKESIQSREQREKSQTNYLDAYNYRLAEWQKEVLKARLKLKKAITNKKNGVTVEEGDFLGNATGGVTPSEQYLKKIANLDKNVKKAQQELIKLLSEKPQRSNFNKKKPSTNKVEPH